MRSADELMREVEALRARMAGLSAAMLRISASLDVDAVLHEIAEAARTLTGARYGVISTLDDEGRPREVISSGFTPEEHRRVNEGSEGPRLFDHFRRLPGPLRVADLPAYVGSLGLSLDVMAARTLQVTPMRHRGVHVGTFLLAEKQGGRGFTDEDEEVLSLFASQAAAIANALHIDLPPDLPPVMADERRIVQVQVWGEPDSADPRLVRPFVKILRRKLGDDASRPTCIFTERGVGYRMAGPDDG